MFWFSWMTGQCYRTIQTERYHRYYRLVHELFYRRLFIDSDLRRLLLHSIPTCYIVYSISNVTIRYYTQWFSYPWAQKASSYIETHTLESNKKSDFHKYDKSNWYVKME